MAITRDFSAAPKPSDSAAPSIARAPSIASSKEEKVLIQQKHEALLQHAINGQLDKVDALLSECPQLALLTGSVKDQAGREFEGTVLRIAAGAEDIGLQLGEVCMVELVCKHLVRLPDGDVEIAKQLREQFPDGWREQERQRVAKDLAALDKVVEAIKHSKSEDDCQSAILEFITYLEQKSVHNTGKQFNPTILGRASRFYDENYNAFGGKDSYKNKLMWCEIIGGIQRLATHCYASALVQGLINIISKKVPLKRELVFKGSEDKECYFPLDGNPDNSLGKHFAVAVDGDRASLIENNDFCLFMLNTALFFQRSAFVHQTHFYFEEYNTKKDEALEKFIQAYLRPSLKM